MYSDWKATFHRIPTAIDNILASRGGERICQMGSADAAAGDMFSDFENWEEKFWEAMGEKYGSEVKAGTAKR
jgi:cytochrome P450/NADPH-cytochrome P450 reductase